MNLENALKRFDPSGDRIPLEQDREAIRKAAVSLGCTDFHIKYFSGKHADGTYITDANDQVHIHSTMVVARVGFTGSVRRGPKPYPNFQYFLQLGRWSRS
jgi:hypothetical protein